MLRTVTGVLPVALVVAVDPLGWNPFGPLRWLVVGVAAGLLVVALGRLGAWRVPRFAAAAWVALLALVLLAAVLAVDPWAAWVGTAERHLGALTWLLLAACFLAGAQLPARAWPDLLRGGAVAALFVGGWAVVERWGGRPVDYASDSQRLGGPFGSAAYLGAACCLLAPLAIGAAAERRLPIAWRAVGAVGAAALAVAVVGSGSRAAWLGLGTAAVVTVVLVAGSRRRLLTVLAALAVVGVAAVGSTLGDVTERAAGGASRLDEWRVATRVIGAHPLAGVGPEGYRIAFAEGVDDAYERTHGRDVQPDRAHSAPLDVAVTIGLPGALVWVGLAAIGVVGAIRAIRRGRAADVALGAAVVATIVQQWFLFPLAELDPLLWLLAGAVVTDTAAVVDRVRIPSLGRALVTAAGGVLVVAAAAAGILDVAADRTARAAAATLGTPEAVAAAERAVERRPDVVRYHLLLAAANGSLGTRRGLDDALAAVADASRWSPADPVVRRREAELLTRRALVAGNPADVTAARAAWDVLVADDPHCGACWLGAGDAAAAAGDEPAAEHAWRRADELAHRDPTAATRLRDLYALEGRADEAARMATRAEALG